MANDQARLAMNKSFLEEFVSKILSDRVVSMIQGHARESLKRHSKRNKQSILFLVQDYGYGRLHLIEDEELATKRGVPNFKQREKAESIHNMIEFIVEEHIEAQLEEDDIAEPQSEDEHIASRKLSRLITHRVYGDILDPLFYE